MLPKANLYDPVATLSRFLTRRFGIVGGLSLFAVLALTEGTAIVGALREEFSGGEAPADAAPVTTSSGLTLADVRLGGGGTPTAGDFLALSLTVSTVSPEGEAVYLLGSAEAGRPASFVFNKARRAQGELRGLEEAVASMRRGGVRDVTLPANVGLGVSVAGLPSRPSPFPLKLRVSLEEVTPNYMY